MIIEIYEDQKLIEISHLFTNIYSFLKIEFYNKPHDWQAASSLKDLLDGNLSVGNVSRKKNHTGFMEFHFWQKTGFLESYFKNRFGLNVQIFRQHGDKWVQTVGTDELTLEQQNEIGRNASYELMHSNTMKFEHEKSI